MLVTSAIEKTLADGPNAILVTDSKESFPGRTWPSETGDVIRAETTTQQTDRKKDSGKFERRSAIGRELSSSNRLRRKEETYRECGTLLNNSEIRKKNSGEFDLEVSYLTGTVIFGPD
jgi:hypothetical protein